MSSGITCPFGQLSRSPGYISDSLLTRSPLCVLLRTVRLACLNHAASVQAEPGSNSSIVFLGPPQSRCDTWNPGCISGALAPSDTFVGWVILEEEFVHPSTSDETS